MLQSQGNGHIEGDGGDGGDHSGSESGSESGGSEYSSECSSGEDESSGGSGGGSGSGRWRGVLLRIVPEASMVQPGHRAACSMPVDMNSLKASVEGMARLTQH